MIPTHNTVPYASRPLVTWGLIGLCIAAFLYQLSLAETAHHRFLIERALVPARYTDAGFALRNGLSRADLLPFLSSLFLHGGILHIASNLWTLSVFGPALEDRLGRARFLLVYLASGIAAGLAHFASAPASAVPALGASGAIAGIIAGYVRRFPYAWINILQPVGLMPVFLFMPALLFAALWFLSQVFGAAGSLATPGGGGVAWFAHIGGFLAGWLLVPRLAPPASADEEVQAATRSLLWPWLAWWRWLGWWWRK